MVVYSVGRQSLAVVDGQQRITTITILLCALREAFKNLGQVDLADGLQAFVEQKDRDNKTVYVLQTETSFPFLQEEILKSTPADVPIQIGREEEAIQKAFEIFGQSLNEMDGYMGVLLKSCQKQLNIVARPGDDYDSVMLVSHDLGLDLLWLATVTHNKGFIVPTF